MGQLLHHWAFRTKVTPVAIAAEIAASVRRRYGVEPVLIRNGIPVDLYRQARAQRLKWREQAGFTEKDLLFVSVARLERQKNPQLLLRAFLQATADLPWCKLLFVGTGALASAVQQEVQEKHVSNRVKLLGLRDSIVSILGSADVFVLASDYEGSPLSVMEALAAGLPVVSTEVGGIPELVQDGYSGLLAPAGDARRLTEIIRHITFDDTLRNRLSRQAAQTAAEFDSGHMVRSYQQLYEQLVPTIRQQRLVEAAASGN